jgi:hypothetical protein
MMKTISRPCGTAGILPATREWSKGKSPDKEEQGEDSSSQNDSLEIIFGIIERATGIPGGFFCGDINYNVKSGT